MLLARDIQRYRACTSGNQDVSSFELPAFGNNHILAGEASNPVKGVDAVFGEISFQIAGDCIGEAAFKHHQVAPIDPRLACDAMPAHTRLRVDRLPTAHQHSLRIAAAQRAGPAEGTVIDQCYRPPYRTHSRACRLRASAGADDHEIVGLHNVVSLEASDRTSNALHGPRKTITRKNAEDVHCFPCTDLMIKSYRHAARTFPTPSPWPTK